MALQRPFLNVQVEVDITMDAFKNAAAHYDSRRKHLTKHEKTVAAAEKVVKAAEKRTQQQLTKVGVHGVHAQHCTDQLTITRTHCLHELRIQTMP